MNRTEFVGLLSKLEKTGRLLVHSTTDNSTLYARCVSFNTENNGIEVEFTAHKEEATTVQKIIDTVEVMNGNIQVRLQGFDMDWDIDELDEPEPTYVFYRRGKFHL